jgi:formate dehydrogenase subunit gamma
MSKKKMIMRFSPLVRITHWIYAISFIVLAITGFMVTGTVLDWLEPLFGGLAGAMVVHRVAAVFLVAAPVISLIVRPAEILTWLKECFSFTENDATFLMTFPYKFIGMKKELPPQGFYNGGEKINSLIQIISGAVLIVTGLFMWLAPAITPLWVYPLHVTFMVIGSMGAIGHIYLAALNPLSNEVARAMIMGDVSEQYMKENHREWYDKVYMGKRKEEEQSAA